MHEMVSNMLFKRIINIKLVDVPFFFSLEKNVDLPEELLVVSVVGLVSGSVAGTVGSVVGSAGGRVSVSVDILEASHGQKDQVNNKLLNTRGHVPEIFSKHTFSTMGLDKQNNTNISARSLRSMEIVI